MAFPKSRSDLDCDYIIEQGKGLGGGVGEQGMRKSIRRRPRFGELL